MGVEGEIKGEAARERDKWIYGEEESEREMEVQRGREVGAERKRHREVEKERWREREVERDAALSCSA